MNRSSPDVTRRRELKGEKKPKGGEGDALPQIHLIYGGQILPDAERHIRTALPSVQLEFDPLSAGPFPINRHFIQ